MSKRPNFVLFITDQHRADYLGCYGHRILRTPNIDAIAKRGVAFDRFYVASPVCMPNRASLMTCRMPSNHGVTMNGVPLSQRNVTFVELLREAGYKTALIGKSHLQTFTGASPITKIPPAREGFFRAGGELKEAVRHDLEDSIYKVEEPNYWINSPKQVPTPFYGFEHVELVTGHGDHVGGDYAEWLLARDPDAAHLIGPENQLPHAYSCPQAVRTAVPTELYSTTYIAERAAAYVEARKDDEEPFFLMVSWPDPHHPFNPPGKYWDMYDPNDFPVPEAFDQGNWSPPPHVAGVLASRDSGKANLEGMNSVGCTARESHDAQALACGMISLIDDAVGAVQEALKSSGKAGETVELFTTDHGDNLGDHKLLFKGAEQYEQVTRVPFIWADPDGETEIRTDTIGQTHDIGATILERARVEAAWGMQGRDLFGLTDRTAAFIQYSHQKDMDEIGIPPNVHSIRDNRFRLSVFENLAWGELYDLENDPGEFENLWCDVDFVAEKARLLECLARAEIACVDRAPKPTGLRQAIEIRVRKGATIAAACEEAGLSPAGWYKAMQRPSVIELLQGTQDRFVSEVNAGRAHMKARALKVAEDLMHNAKSENVRARMAEFLASDGKVSQVSVHVDARSAPTGYEMARPGQRVVEIDDGSGKSCVEIVD